MWKLEIGSQLSSQNGIWKFHYVIFMWHINILMIGIMMKQLTCLSLSSDSLVHSKPLCVTAVCVYTGWLSGTGRHGDRMKLVTSRECGETRDPPGVPPHSGGELRALPSAPVWARHTKWHAISAVIKSAGSLLQMSTLAKQPLGECESEHAARCTVRSARNTVSH